MAGDHGTRPAVIETGMEIGTNGTDITGVEAEAAAVVATAMTRTEARGVAIGAAAAIEDTGSEDTGAVIGKIDTTETKDDISGIVLAAEVGIVAGTDTEMRGKGAAAARRIADMRSGSAAHGLDWLILL